MKRPGPFKDNKPTETAATDPPTPTKPTKKRRNPEKTNNFYKKLHNISNYDVFWFATAVFVLRVLWFLYFNGMPHKPIKK